MIIIRLLLVLGAVSIYLFVWPGQIDWYHAAAGSVALIISGSIAIWWSSRSGKSEEEFTQDDPEIASMLEEESRESFGSAIVKGFLLGIVVFGLAWLLAWVGAKTPAYGWFYDIGFESFLHDLDVLVEEDSYKAAISRIDLRLEQPLSEPKQLVLVHRKYDYYLTLGRQAIRAEEKEAYFLLAKDVAETWQLDGSLADAEYRAVRPTATPYPTPTPRPTTTPMPTWTPYPTSTPMPTATPDVGRPPLDFSRCTEVLVNNSLEVSGVLRAWECGDWGCYGQWQPVGEENPIGGRLPQLYVSSSVGRFYLCPPVGENQDVYTEKECD